jgi:hypothetical protein
MRQIYVSLMILGWFAVPGFVSADWSMSSHISRADRHTADRGVLERDSLIHRVQSPQFKDHFGLSLGRDRGRSELERDRESDSAASGEGMRSPGPSVDMPGKVDGDSRGPDPWLGRRPEGEPMIKDLNRNPKKTP